MNDAAVDTQTLPSNISISFEETVPRQALPTHLYITALYPGPGW